MPITSPATQLTANPSAARAVLLPTPAIFASLVSSAAASMEFHLALSEIKDMGTSLEVCSCSPGNSSCPHDVSDIMATPNPKNVYAAMKACLCPLAQLWVLCNLCFISCLLIIRFFIFTSPDRTTRTKALVLGIL